MNNQKKAFYIILAVVLITGMIFSLYTFSTIRSIHGLRTALEKISAEHSLVIRKDAASSTEIRKIIPQQIWTTEFIETAYAISRKYGLQDLTFMQKTVDSPRRQTQGKSQQSLHAFPVKMSFHARYREMAGFIEELQELDRLITIDSLKVTPDKNTLSVEMTANTYALEER